jgi:hypothetical protein
MKWGMAIFCFGCVIALFDTLYVMPNYSPNIDGNSFWDTRKTVLPVLVIVSGLKFLFGIPLILFGIMDGNFIFSSTAFGSAAASALVMYVILVPYLVVLSFIIEGHDGIPPAYRFFQFFITKSGSKHVDQDFFNPQAFDQDVRGTRADRYQAKMEEEELLAAAQRARDEAEKVRVKDTKRMEAEAARLRAAEEAAKAAEEKYRAKVRERERNRHR